MRIPIDLYILKIVKGFLDEEEGQYLYDIACNASRMGPCLEIGSYCGKSALYIGCACKKNNGILYSIDHHRGSEEQQPGEEYFDPELFDVHTRQVDTFKKFRENLEIADLTDTVVPIVCRSEVAARMWSTPLSFVFIDGGHTYETVLSDYHSWSKHIMIGGYLLIHDVFEDPKKGGQAPYQLYQTALISGCYRKLPKVKTLGVLQRIGKTESNPGGS